MSTPLSARLNETAPRYTSYPTAPHFHPGIGSGVVERWIGTIDAEEPLSLYLHVPFCDRLCWFCACNTKQTLRYEPVAAYLASVHREIATVSRLLAGRGRVAALHLGGGSPTMLRPDDLVALDAALRRAFSFRDDAEISVEIEPNDMDEARLDALAAIGLTRASLGIQDFDPRVQEAINREQGFELTATVVEGLRKRGIRSANFDLLYGLPFQTRDSIASTVRQALTLLPDRIALFGYAHVPWFKKHQQMIDEAALREAGERFAQARLAGEIVRDHGLDPIGLDHFARSGDSLAVAAREGRLRRNFQGYTNDQCETMIGLGASSVSRYRQGYAQNLTATGIYSHAADAGGLAIARGIELTDEDRMRGWIIERLMCDFGFSIGEAVGRFGDAARDLVAGARIALRQDEMVDVRGDRFVVRDAGRPLVRLIAAQFDSYLASGKGRHSAAV